MLNAAIVAATMAEIKIKHGVVLEQLSLSIPSFNHTGININAPPIAKVAPTSPAKNPTIKNFQTFSSVITALEIS